jgi:hypothetical protein
MYKLNQFGGVIRESDGAFIPADEANRDYAAYLAWVAEGNTPTPYTPPPRPVAELVDAIDTHVADIYSNWSRFQQEYLLRQQAAQAFKDAGYAGDPGPWVSAYAVAASTATNTITNQQAADTILAQAANLNAALQQLGALRMRKYEVMNAADAVTAQAVYDDIVSKINTIAAALQ